jgi:hypothetical protein
VQDAGINVGAVRPDDGAEFLVHRHRREHCVVAADVLEHRPLEQRAKVYLPRCAVSKSVPHPALAEDDDRAYAGGSPRRGTRSCSQPSRTIPTYYPFRAPTSMIMG